MKERLSRGKEMQIYANAVSRKVRRNTLFAAFIVLRERQMETSHPVDLRTVNVKNKVRSKESSETVSRGREEKKELARNGLLLIRFP